MSDLTIEDLHEMYHNAIVSAGGDIEFLQRVQLALAEIMQDPQEFIFNADEEDGDPGPPVGTSGQEMYDGIFNMVFHFLMHYNALYGRDIALQSTKLYLESISNALDTLIEENKQEG